MNEKQLNEYTGAIEKAVAQERLRDALSMLEAMSGSQNPLIDAAIRRTAEDYRRIIEFALTGNPDPTRAGQISQIKHRIYSLLDRLVRESELPEKSTLYYNTLRTERLNPSGAPGQLIDRLRTPGLSQSEIEELERQLFESLWVTNPLSHSDYDTLTNAATDPAVPERSLMVVIGAVTLGALQIFDENALRTLLDIALVGRTEAISVRATVGAVLVMARWPRRSNIAPLREQITLVREAGTWSSDVEMILMQTIRMANVEKLSRELRDEIMPEMLKLRPDLYSRINNPDEILEINPEWEEKLRQSGLEERLRKLSEQISEGGDPFYSAFAMLKSDRFFNHPRNWFLPFDPTQSNVVQALGNDKAIGQMVAATPTMCDSDKYSFVLSINQLPEAHRQAMMSQLEQAGVDISDIKRIAAETVTRKSLIDRYVQDLFRFFRLFRRKGEFADPFAAPINPISVSMLADDFASPDKIRLIAEFFFSHAQWADAADLFGRIASDAETYQKLGHSLRKLGRPHQAADALERAYTYEPKSAWTLRHLASALRAAGQPSKALKYYEELEAMQPDTFRNAMNMGYCHLEADNNREALHCFYKAEFLDEKSPKVLRPIAWAAFLNSDFETSQKYYERLMLVDTPTETDYLNMGHLALAMGRIRDALNYYRLHSEDTAKLRERIDADRPLLAAAGVDLSIVPLLLDSL